MSDRYGADVLSSDPHRRPGPALPVVEASVGLVVECAESGFCGSVVRTEKSIEGRTVELEDHDGKTRVFVMREGSFLIDGKPVTLAAPRVGQARPTRTLSGSAAAAAGPAKVARGSRILVEGIHDGELVEKIWGGDLREEAIVVEPLHGADNLMEWLLEFGPTRHRRVGVLLDHMVPGSREQRIADQVSGQLGANVLIVGHPYVDVWQAVRPAVLGLDSWPTVPRGESWKAGVLRAIGWDPDERLAWRRIINSVSSYTDLEPSMLGRVEELIDFVTVDPSLR
ncbi:MAG: DUF3097 family protein [Candidatus Nanopelagicales bacterium]|nr:DUF3097 family protein [Candidatus Nanopelagicales bacterium]